MCRVRSNQKLRDLRQHATLAGNRVGHHHVEGAQAIGGDDQHVLLVDRVDVAHLALMDALCESWERAIRGIAATIAADESGRAKRWVR